MKTCAVCGSAVREERRTYCGYVCSNRARRPATPERFWARVNKNGPTVRSELGPCWLWTAARWANGYGCAHWNGRRRKAHALAFEIANATAVEGGVVRHRCDNPPCCNPDHLEIGTPVDNVADRDARGRTAKGERVTIGKLTEDDVVAIRSMYVPRKVPLSRLASMFGVSKKTVGAVLRRETWRHVA